MAQEQNSTISGSVYDNYTTNSQEYKENRMPRVGQKVEYEDGRKYVFCRTETTVERGMVVGLQTDTETSLPVDTGAVNGAVAAGSKTIVIDGLESAVTANELAKGYITIAGDPDATNGLGYTYRIKSNTAADIAADVTLTLYDTLEQGVADDAVVEVVGSRPQNVSPTLVGTHDPIGVAVTHNVGTADVPAFFWAQYKGVGAVQGDTAGVAVGAAFTIMDEAGEVGVTTGVEPIYGYALAALVNGEAHAAMLDFCA